MDKIASRAFPAFAVGFSLFFAPAYGFTSGDATFSWPLFTYFPSVGDYGELHPGLVAGSDTLGPPMWWYGWLASAALVGLIFAAISLLLPEKSTLKMWSVAIWVVPLVFSCAAVLGIGVHERGYRLPAGNEPEEGIIEQEGKGDKRHHPDGNRPHLHGRFLRQEEREGGEDQADEGG